eukprot:62453_1
MAGATQLFHNPDYHGIRYEFIAFSGISLVFTVVQLICEFTSFDWDFHMIFVWRAAWSLTVFINCMVIPVGSTFDFQPKQDIRASICGNPVSGVHALKRILATPKLRE